MGWYNDHINYRFQPSLRQERDPREQSACERPLEHTTAFNRQSIKMLSIFVHGRHPCNFPEKYPTPSRNAIGSGGSGVAKDRFVMHSIKSRVGLTLPKPVLGVTFIGRGHRKPTDRQTITRRRLTGPRHQIWR